MYSMSAERKRNRQPLCRPWPIGMPFTRVFTFTAVVSLVSRHFQTCTSEALPDALATDWQE